MSVLSRFSRLSLHSFDGSGDLRINPADRFAYARPWWDGLFADSVRAVRTLPAEPEKQSGLAPLNGTSGDDFFAGTSGDDVYSGGDGNDRINDGGGGNDILNGDGGDDVIIIERSGGTRNNVTVNAGTGNDLVLIGASTGGLFTIDLGAGDDLLIAGGDGLYVTDITLGSGMDSVQFDRFSSLIIRDFTPGDAGDTFTFPGLTFRSSNYSSGQNPFSSGHLTLTQDGTDSVLTFYASGNASGEALVIGIFRNTQIASFTAHNFGGFTPSGRRYHQRSRRQRHHRRRRRR
jgi:Ca2+-binding RTX toxin-like protein